MAQTFIVHYFGLLTLDVQLVVATHSPGVDMLLLVPYLVTLLTMPVEEHSRLLEFMMIDSLEFILILILMSVWLVATIGLKGWAW